MTKEEQIKHYAKTQLGIDLIGISSAQPNAKAKADLKEFLQRGYQGKMKYLEDFELRTDPQKLFPGAKSIIVIGVNYYRQKAETPPDHGRIARYAWGRDYHKVFRNILKQLHKYLDENWPGQSHRPCTDSAPLLEKIYAEQAGLGFYGKNTLLINPELGSFFLLGEIVTTMELTPDSPHAGTCGNCRRCMDACPTGALIAPGQIDARRCISYLTIETKDAIPEEFGPASKNLIMGCDICQEVCPYNLQLAQPAACPGIIAKQIAGDSIPLKEILQIQTDQEYVEKFAGSPLMRPKREGLIKNAINAASNACTSQPDKYRKTFIPLLQEISVNDENENLRQIATETLKRIGTNGETISPLAP
jgi:epoxyqueuosine reductase